MRSRVVTTAVVLGIVAMAACGQPTSSDPSCQAFIDAARAVGAPNQADLEAMKSTDDVEMGIRLAERVQGRLRTFMATSDNLGTRLCQVNSGGGKSTFQIAPEELERARAMLKLSPKQFYFEIKASK
jgi:hypothetical protein